MKKLNLEGRILTNPEMKKLAGGYDMSTGKSCSLFCGDVRSVWAAWSGTGPCPGRDAVASYCGGSIPAGTSCNCI